MSNYNRVILIGRLTRDPQPITINNLTRGAKFGLAVNNRRLVNGEWTDVPVFVDITVWDRSEGGKPGTLALNTLRKGSLIHVEGKLHMETWVDRATDQQRSKLTVTCDQWSYLEKKAEATPTPPAEAPAPAEEVAEEAATVAEEAARAPRRGRSRKPAPTSGEDAPF